jgi:hypothetical protein
MVMNDNTLYQLRTSVLTIINVVSFVGIVYYSIPGYSRVFTTGTGAQPTAIAICVIVFLIAFLTAVQLTPKKDAVLRGTNIEDHNNLTVKTAKEHSNEMLKKYGNRG